MIAKATRDAQRQPGRLARMFESLRCFCEDVSDTVVAWWNIRFPGGPAVPLDEVKKRAGL
jgi:hypothetical protein